MAESREAVAYALMQDIMAWEGAENGQQKWKRAGILDLYAECLVATTGRRGQKTAEEFLDLVAAQALADAEAR